MVVSMSERDMRQYVLGLVRSFVANHSLPMRPYWHQVEQAFGLPKVQFDHLPLDRDGKRSERQIIINRSLLSCRERVEFTLFHELLHILIEEDGLIISELDEHSNVDGGKEAAERWLETLCDLGAAEFVLPSEAFARFMGERGWSIGLVPEAATNFRSSVVAAAFQYAHCCPNPCAVLVCEHGRCPERSDSKCPRPSANAAHTNKTPNFLYVAYAPSHPDAYPMVRHVPVPTDHLIKRAWLTEGVLKGEAPGLFRNRRGYKMPCEAVRIGNRVYAAMYGSTSKTKTSVEPPSKHQLALL